MTSGDWTFGKLYVPERILDINTIIHDGAQIDPTMNHVYDRIVGTQSCAPKGQPILLKRPVGHRRAHPEEEAIYSELERRGVCVFSGGNLTVEEQIQACAATPVLIGFSGSNLHNNVFAGPQTTVVELQDFRSSQNRKKWDLQCRLAELRGQEFIRVPTYAMAEPLPLSVICETVQAILASNP